LRCLLNYELLRLSNYLLLFFWAIECEFFEDVLCDFSSTVKFGVGSSFSSDGFG
jgi:hypothetical protein